MQILTLVVEPGHVSVVFTKYHSAVVAIPAQGVVAKPKRRKVSGFVRRYQEALPFRFVGHMAKAATASTGGFVHVLTSNQTQPERFVAAEAQLFLACLQQIFPMRGMDNVTIKAAPLLEGLMPHQRRCSAQSVTTTAK